MTEHSENPSSELVEEREALNDARPAESNTHGSGRLSRKLLYWWSLTVAGALLLILGTPVIFFSWLARRRHWIYPAALFGARNWLRLSGMKVKVVGRENLDPAQPYVFIANHRSYLDTATVFYHLGRRIGLVAKKELLRVPILGIGMGFANVMAIDRSNRERAIQTMREATRKLRSGTSFAVFAEGKRAGRNELLPFKKGGFYMAVEAGVPIVPIAIKNTDELMGKGTGEAKPGTIEMVILPPVETAGLSTDEDIERLIARVHARIAAELGIKDSV
ncbi:MAG TPA: lysophospholipid acyltransferase family protein [Pyrinomonadaceae bacterium]